ncbi:erythromycin esterase family protein [Hymenobacter tenuis]
MKTLFRSLLAAALMTTATLATQAQPSTPAADTARITLDASIINPVSTQSFEAFRTAVQPLVKQMAGKQVVAMGEGTHGTSEFYKLRFWLTRILMEEYGFDRLGLENTYGDTYLLNQAMQQPKVDLKPLMQKHMLSMWQNQEMAELLTWMQGHNRTHRRNKVELTGIDAMFSNADAQLLQQGLAKTKRPELQTLTAQLVKNSAYMDNMWYHAEDTSYHLNRKEWLANGMAGYEAADQLEKALPGLRLPRKQREVLAGAAKNARMRFDLFYQAKVYKRNSSRDSVFAEMTKFLVGKKQHKVIIWAHNAHVARTVAAPGDNNGGGTGSFLDRMFPGQYFVLATGTTSGTFSATTQRFISPASVMTSYPLEMAKAGSWEASLGQVSSPVYYFNTNQLGAKDLKRPHRLVGQTVGSEDFYNDTQLSAAYDAMLFVRQSTAATPLR